MRCRAGQHRHSPSAIARRPLFLARGQPPPVSFSPLPFPPTRCYLQEMAQDDAGRTRRSLMLITDHSSLLQLTPLSQVASPRPFPHPGEQLTQNCAQRPCDREGSLQTRRRCTGTACWAPAARQRSAHLTMPLEGVEGYVIAELLGQPRCAAAAGASSVQYQLMNLGNWLVKLLTLTALPMPQSESAGHGSVEMATRRTRIHEPWRRQYAWGRSC